MQPKWLTDAVIYQLYPQSFNDSNGDGIGDFQGIIEKVDYLKDLGINLLWLNPCFDSPFGDAGYDVRNFMKIAPLKVTADSDPMHDQTCLFGLRLLLFVFEHIDIVCDLNPD